MQITVSTGQVQDFTQHARERLQDYTESVLGTIVAEAIGIAASRSLDSGRLEVTHQDVEHGYRAYAAKAGAASRRAQAMKTIGGLLVGVLLSLSAIDLVGEHVLTPFVRLGTAAIFAVTLVCATILSWRN